MDRKWIHNPNRTSTEYLLGIEEFIRVAKNHVNHRGHSKCPCQNCNNCSWRPVNEIQQHLITHGMAYNYKKWNHHGERLGPAQRSSTNNESLNPPLSDDFDRDNDQVMDIINDMYPHASHKSGQTIFEDDNVLRDDDDMLGDNETSKMRTEEMDKYERLLKEAQNELYPGCKDFSVLTSIVELMELKVRNLMTNKCFDELMGIFKRMLPKGNQLPPTHRHAHKVLKDLGLGYEKIHACKYDCALFYKENEGLDNCPVCNEPRYLNSTGDKKKIPQKVLRYFPLKPRLQRLYMSNHTASDMRWHRDERVDDGGMRHPADTIAWKEFDKMYPNFAAESRNVRLGLATDGFNPFGDMNKPYSMWPVVVVPYNLPPWMCMKKEFTMLTLLIPGKHEPGKDIDVYLRPLIDELKELWETGVRTYDKSTDTMFNLRAAVLWTINDLPAYGNLSGWSTKGYNACPICNDDGTSGWFSDKVCYMGHRRWLPSDHFWRNITEAFDGKTEFRARPRQLSGDEILSQLQNVNFGKVGKHPNNPDRKRKRTLEERNWTKKSIFFELEYWSKLKIRHNLDVMHIEKNVCDTIIGTILGLEGKSKDTIKARQDLEALGIKKSLWLKWTGEKWVKGHPFFTMKPNLKKDFLQFLKSVKYPDGYAANISRNVVVETGKISGLKSHDYHVLLQRLLPVGIRKYLPKEVVEPIVQLSNFFQQLCAKTLHMDDIERLEDDIIYILCKFEQIFPPAFFVSMIHLLVHLPEEAKLAGPVSYRWMYPIERMLGTYKKYVRNRARPEGSIAEAYVAHESLTFCAMYLRNVETSFNRNERNFDGGPRREKLSVFSQVARPFMSSSSIPFTNADMEIAQWFILNNCEEVLPFLTEHEEVIKSENKANVHKRHRKLFPNWFRERVRSLREEKSPLYSDELFELARGPLRGETYQGCIVNGVRFTAAERDDKLTTQNSGVFVPGNHDTENIDFYGKLISVVELLYRQRYKVVLFKCHWYNTNPHRLGSIKRDYHLMSVNSNTRWYESDPYILATMAKQVFYVDDPKAGGGWKIVQKMAHRHIYDLPRNDTYNSNDDNNDVACQETSSSDVPHMANSRDYNVIQNPLLVEEVPPILIDPKAINGRLCRKNGDTTNENDKEDDDELVEENSEYSLEDSDFEL